MGEANRFFGPICNCYGDSALYQGLLDSALSNATPTTWPSNRGKVDSNPVATGRDIVNAERDARLQWFKRLKSACESELANLPEPVKPSGRLEEMIAVLMDMKNRYPECADLWAESGGWQL